MKKTIALILTMLLALSCLVLPALAQDEEDGMYYWDWSDHHTALKHPGLMVLGYTLGTEIGNPYQERTHMTVDEMAEVVKAVLADEDQTVIGEDLEINTDHIRYLEDRTVTCPEAPFRCLFRVWGADNRVVLVFHLAQDAEEWTLILAQKGSDVMPEFPGDGTYAVATVW